VTLLNTLLAAFDSALANVAHQITFVEIVAAATLITLPSAIMVMMVRYFNQMRREPQIVYRIPVVAM
jgi:hypothetical protein